MELVKDRILEPTNSSLAEVALSVRSSMKEAAPQFPPPNSSSHYDPKLSESTSPLASSPGDPYGDSTSPPCLTSPSMTIGGHLHGNLVRPSLKHGGGSGSDIGKVPSPSQSRKKQQKGKYRKLRYHEYVPPTKSNSKGGKTTPSKPPKMDTPYALLLQQQQVFLQLQVLQQQYPNGVLAQKLPDLLKNMPASMTEKAQAMLKPKVPGVESQKGGGMATSVTKTHEIPDDIRVHGPNGTIITVRLDELKVNSLKAACKEMNLIVSGKKVELIERLLEHNNGVLPSSVLQDQKRHAQQQQSHSFESQASTTTSPESPSPSPVFQYSAKALGSSSFSSFFQPRENGASVTMETLDVPPEGVQVSVCHHKVKGLGGPPPLQSDRKHSVKLSQVVPETGGGGGQKNFNYSKSLPSSPQQVSPTGSASDLIHDLMEQSPLPHHQQQQQQQPSTTLSPDSLLVSSSSYSPSHHSLTNTLTITPMDHASNHYLSTGRHGRCSLPAPPPPYPGLQHNHSFDQVTSGYLYQSHHPHPPSHPPRVSSSVHAPPQRSFSVSGPSMTQRSSSLDISHNQHSLPQSTLLAQANKPAGANTDHFLFPADEGAPASELMDVSLRREGGREGGREGKVVALCMVMCYMYKYRWVLPLPGIGGVFLSGSVVGVSITLNCDSLCI